jgi:uncharacterized protein
VGRFAQSLEFNHRRGHRPALPSASNPLAPLKLHADRLEGVNAISSVTAHAVSVNGVAYRHSILVPWQGEVIEWGTDSFDLLTAEHFARVAERAPELVIFGSGPRLRFPQASWIRPLIERRIGIETMDTAAACRTYNILVGEGRSAIAALLLSPPQVSSG